MKSKKPKNDPMKNTDSKVCKTNTKADYNFQQKDMLKQSKADATKLSKESKKKKK